MNIVVFGASGRVGAKVVHRLLADDHEVVAFVHGKHQLPESEKIKVVQGDIYNSDAVAHAIKGADVVISALGSGAPKKKDVWPAEMRTIIPAMKELNCLRIISLTGAGAFGSSDTPTSLDKLNHFLLGIIAPKILHDGEEHMQLLRESGLNWTVLRSPVMKAGSKRGYKLGKKFPLPWATIDREDVVDAMIQILDDHSFFQEAPFITRA